MISSACTSVQKFVTLRAVRQVERLVVAAEIYVTQEGSELRKNCFCAWHVAVFQEVLFLPVVRQVRHPPYVLRIDIRISRSNSGYDISSHFIAVVSADRNPFVVNLDIRLVPYIVRPCVNSLSSAVRIQKFRRRPLSVTRCIVDFSAPVRCAVINDPLVSSINKSRYRSRLYGECSRCLCYRA